MVVAATCGFKVKLSTASLEPHGVIHDDKSFISWLNRGGDVLLAYLEVLSPVLWAAPPLLHNGVIVQPCTYSDSFFIPLVCCIALSLFS